MEFTKESMLEIERLALEADKVELIPFEGRTYTKKALSMMKGPRPEPLHVYTLGALIDYLKSNVDKLDKDKIIIHVQDPETVAVFSEINGPDMSRNIYLFAHVRENENRYTFNNFMESEAFIIKLMSLFESSPTTLEILKLAGNLTDESVKTSQDDGTSQTVTARAGIVKAQNVAVKNPVTLAPYRTFREIKQPESNFILRFKGGGNGSAPTCALFEADGGTWKLEAVQRIAAYLQNNLPGVNIIA